MNRMLRMRLMEVAKIMRKRRSRLRMKTMNDSE
jgi:hypothetical protein